MEAEGEKTDLDFHVEAENIKEAKEKTLHIYHLFINAGINLKFNPKYNHYWFDESDLK